WRFCLRGVGSRPILPAAETSVGEPLPTSRQDRRLVLEHGADLLAQLRRVLVAMRGNRVLRGRPDHLLLFARDGQRAADLIREIAAICYLTCHCLLLLDCLSSMRCSHLR